MAGNPLLTVLLTTHARPEHLEDLLDSLLGFEMPDAEIIVLNDNCDPAHAKALRLLLDLYPNDRTFYFEHDKECGRSQSLNEGLLQSEGSLVWAPLRADRLNKGLLVDTIRKMESDPAAFWVLDHHLPGTIHEWFEQIEDGALPSDNCFLFNRNVIPPDQFFFNEHLNQNIAAELGYRLLQKKKFQQTDAFFVVEKSGGMQPGPKQVQEFLFSMLRETDNRGERLSIIEQIRKVDFSPAVARDEPEGLEKLIHTAEEDPRLALDLVNNFLRHHPEHHEALRLKVTLLEKLRRHVEAAELKHDLVKIKKTDTETEQDTRQSALFGAGDKPARESAKPDEQSIQLSIVIPTTGNGKPLLENCLLQLEKFCDPATTELIIVDNASIDDTFDYLEQLQEEQFLNISVITNSANTGFGASANQGLEAANGRYILLIHNDLILNKESLEEMLFQMGTRQFIGAIGPYADYCDLDQQCIEASVGKSDGFIETGYIDSCCMLVRASTGVRFSESYGLAFYEDRDFCNRLKEAGYFVAIAAKGSVKHLHRATTDAMGLNLEPDFRWKNADIFNAKWGQSPELIIPRQGEITDILKKIARPVNPQNPPGYWLDQIDSLFSDEVKTEIHNREMKSDDLFNLIWVLMIADKRDFLRQIETRVQETALPSDLLQALIRYYFRRNIYSRCKLYLEKPESKGPFYDLFRLRIAVDEKEHEEAAALLSGLMENFPCHPDLYRMASEIHKMDGNEGEAKSFAALADQLDPVSETGQEDAFEIKF